jgi:hypothetical protein
MIVTREKTQLNEMARICKKSDGYGIIIELRSRDHGEVGNKRSPAHLHLFDTNMNPLGEFELTASAPKKTSDIVWYRTSNPPEGYASSIVKWANGSRQGVNNWILAVLEWEDIHAK